MNTLTNLIPTIYQAMDVVSRELVGFITAATMDASANRAAVGQSITTPIVPASAAEDIAPSTNPPDTGDQDIGNLTMAITKARAVPFRWTGEESKSLGASQQVIQRDQIAQAIRTLTNEVETDLFTSAYQSASRATGIAGTSPFASSLGDTAQALKILKDNGAPSSDLNLVINTTAGANLRTLTHLSKANEAGSDATLRRGEILNIHGFSIRESGQAGVHTKGTGTGYLVNGTLAKGATVIPCDTGTGTVLAGDITTIAGDSNKYVVTKALAGGSYEIGAPGLLEAPADGAAITIGNDHESSVAFHRNSLVLLARAPALPDGGDAAADRIVVSDPVSGLSFEFAMYPQYRRMRYEVALAWGTKGIKSNHSALLLG